MAVCEASFELWPGEVMAIEGESQQYVTERAPRKKHYDRSIPDASNPADAKVEDGGESRRRVLPARTRNQAPKN
jgi:ABC-type phosphonate transport system ATPase subunit